MVREPRAGTGGRGTRSWLPVLDNLERALEHAASDPESVVEGVRPCCDQAVGVLAGLGYPRRDDNGRGRSTRPCTRRSAPCPASGLVPGTVAQVVRPGYGPDDKLLRPAAVVVATRAT